MGDFMKRKINRGTIPPGSTIYFNNGEFLNDLTYDDDYSASIKYSIISSSFLRFQTSATSFDPNIVFIGSQTPLTTLCINIKTGLPDVVTEFIIWDSITLHKLNIQEWKTPGIKKITGVNLKNLNQARINFSFKNPDTNIPSKTTLLEINSIWAE